MTPELTEGNSYKYKVGDDLTMPEAGESCASGWTEWNGESEIQAITGRKIVVAEVDASNKCIGVGMTEITAAE